LALAPAPTPNWTEVTFSELGSKTTVKSPLVIVQLVLLFWVRVTCAWPTVQMVPKAAEAAAKRASWVRDFRPPRQKVLISRSSMSIQDFTKDLLQLPVFSAIFTQSQ
jgi:hypothetical protein